MEATHEIIHRRWDPDSDGVDPYGNPVPEFIEEPVLIYAWWVPETGEVLTAGRDGVMADLTFLAPTFPVDDRDEFVIPAFSPKPLRVVGEAQPYDFGPFGWKPGMQVDLRWAEG